MEHRIEQEYLDHRFGFPVVIRNAPLRKALNEWVLDVNANDLRNAVMAALVFKPATLTGNEVKALRLYIERTVSSFAEDCGVTHPAVLKWESAGEEPTKMAAGTEFLVRFLLLDRLAGELQPENAKAAVEGESENLQLLPQNVLPLSRRLSSMWGKRASARRGKADRTMPSIVIDSAGRPVLASS